jgi:uncharacterized protein (TIGR02996 family)
MGGGTAMEHLQEALAHLRSRRAEDALERLLEAWRARRAPEIAELVSALSARVAKTRPRLTTKSLHEGLTQWLERARLDDPADLGPLLEAYEAAAKKQVHTRYLVPRLDEIVRRGNDPRVVLPLVRTLDVLSSVSHSTQVAYRVFQGLLVADDARAIAHLSERLASFRQLKVDENAYGSTVRTYVLERGTVALEKLRKRHPEGAPDAPEGSKVTLEAIASEIEALPKDLVPRSLDTSKKGVEELLAEVFEHPDDDDLRLVLADALQLRQDPRGELIALQIARHRTQPQPPPSAREVALLRRHRKDWLGPLVTAVRPAEAVFARGFLETCQVRFKNAQHARADGDHREWATVRSVSFVNHARVTPAMRSLRSVIGLGHAGLLALCAAPPPHLSQLQVELLDGDPIEGGRPVDPSLVALAATPLPELRSLRLKLPSHIVEEGVDGLPQRRARTAADYQWLPSAPFAGTLRHLELCVEPEASATFVELVLRLAGLERLMMFSGSSFGVAMERLADGVAVTLRAPTGNVGPWLERFFAVLAALAAEPSVVELRLTGPAPTALAPELAARFFSALADRPELRVLGPDAQLLRPAGAVSS